MVEFSDLLIRGVYLLFLCVCGTDIFIPSRIVLVFKFVTGAIWDGFCIAFVILVIWYTVLII